jgi:undecaprenyl-phosphate galactose phosphotransferase
MGRLIGWSNKTQKKLGDNLLKRSFDILGSIFFMVLLFPLLLLLVVLVRKDGGSSIYYHERIGFNGKKFKCYKFRSMVMNSEEVLEELLAKDSEARAEWEKNFKLKNDPRITPVGVFLRKTSLDELPQLFNVLVGDMSLVGPRPIVEEELIRYGSYSSSYLSARPGMTGLWQVSGRNNTTYQERVELDYSYIKSWQIWKDFILILKTVKVVFYRDGAY